MSILNAQSQSANGATNPTMDINEVHNSRPRGRNKFSMNYNNLFTARFGELTPFLCFQTTEQDTIGVACRHETRSYTLSAPLMSGIKFVKDSHAVSMQCLLPRNWDIIYKNPKFGDDVPADANSVMPEKSSGVASFGDILSSKWNGFLRYWYYMKNTATTATAAELQNFLKAAIAMEWFASPGSLLNTMGYHAHSSFIVSSSLSTNSGFIYYTFDQLLEQFFAKLKDISFSLSASAGSIGYDPKNPQVGYNQTASFHAALTFMRDNLDFTLTTNEDGSTIRSLFDVDLDFEYSAVGQFNDGPFNYAPLLAYQAVCAQLYTKDNIDDLYNWEMHLAAAENLVASGSQLTYVLQTFDYNGNKRLYDVYSGYYFNRAIGNFFSVGSATVPTLSISSKYILYLATIFSFRHSLRLGDYFAGSRPNPLAIGDVSAPVVNSAVSAIDTTKSILMQRFLNAVNKASGQIQGYEQEVLGGNLPADLKLPKYISHEVDGVSSDEIENTANDQGNIVQNVRSYGGKYLFETSFSSPAFIIGICYFDASRIYSKTIDRVFLQVDRFDMFNPYLQTIGDQPIYKCELDASKPFSSNFGYQTRNADMKQRYSVASGGFVSNLPAWAFVTDNESAGESGGDVISSRFVRNYPHVFDRFYSSLTGSTLSSYFHFIVKMDIDINARRSMLKSPTIL